MHLMFDLDGTLADSRVGITRCIQHALTEAGAIAPPLEELTRYVGPPLSAAFASLLRTDDMRQIQRAITSYRRCFDLVGLVENRLFPGIPEMLLAFEAAGHDMFVVTSKPRLYALRILEHLGIRSMFRAVHGPELEARRYTKEGLIREALVSAPPGTNHAIMIGDRAEDVHGAEANGLGTVAVAWGYGDPQELDAARPDRIVASPGELMAYVLELESAST